MSSTSTKEERNKRFFDLKDHPTVNYEGLNKHGMELLKDGVRPLTMKRVKKLHKYTLRGFLERNKVAAASQEIRKSRLAHISIALIRAVEGQGTEKKLQKKKKEKAQKVLNVFQASVTDRAVLSSVKQQEIAKIQLELKNLPELPRNATPRCSICLEKEVQFAFDHCGHAAVCEECKDTMIATSKKVCPICRKPFNKCNKLLFV